VVTDLMLDLVGAALACNLTRIVTFQLGYCGNQWSYRFLGFTEDCHAIAHRDTVDGANVSAGEVMTAVSRWTSEKVARLVNGLEAVPEGDGTALDNSLVVWSNENASGVHTLGPLPVVMVGRAGGDSSKAGSSTPESSRTRVRSNRGAYLVRNRVLMPRSPPASARRATLLASRSPSRSQLGRNGRRARGELRDSADASDAVQGSRSSLLSQWCSSCPGTELNLGHEDFPSTGPPRARRSKRVLPALRARPYPPASSTC
jgi:hypothetical protein